MIARALVRREMRDAVRRYWFLVNAGVFAVAGIALMAVGDVDSAVLGYRGFGRALAGLMHLSLVLVPLMAMIPALVAIAGERETGTLDFILAQPLLRSDVYFGKWIGVTSAVVASLAAGFSIAGLIAALRGVPGAMIAALIALTILLALSFVSIGLLVSVHTGSQTRATSVGMTLWLVLLGLGSLGVIGAFIQWGLPAWLLQTWAVVNPIEAYRIAGITVLDPDPTALGPIGNALFERFGRPAVVALAAGSMLVWTGAASVAGLLTFSGTIGTRASRPRRRPA